MRIFLPIAWPSRAPGEYDKNQGVRDIRAGIMRILVVEDERKVASFIRRGLEEEGYAVELAPDGAVALDLVLGDPPYDLVVLDLMLPKRDGFAVLRTLRDARVGTPV